MTVDYGSDLGTFPDLDPMGGMVSGTRAVAESAARKLMQRRGSNEDEPTVGIDILDWLNETQSPFAALRLQAEAREAIESDERVERANVTVEFNVAAQRIRLKVRGECAAGPFAFVLGISDVGATTFEVTS